MTTADQSLNLLKTGTLSPARRQRVARENSECGRVVRCSLVSDPPCPCLTGSSPPPLLRTAPCLDFALSFHQSSGPRNSSCCVLAAGPRRGVSSGTTRAVVWRRSGASLKLRPSLSPASSVCLKVTEWVGHWLETKLRVQNEFSF